VTNAILARMEAVVSSVDLQVSHSIINLLFFFGPCSRMLLPTHALSGISDAYYCAECTRLEKDRDGCPKIVNLGASRTDLFYERRRLGEL
jgi:PHF5-like protein